MSGSQQHKNTLAMVGLLKKLEIISKQFTFFIFTPEKTVIMLSMWCGNFIFNKKQSFFDNYLLKEVDV